MPARISNSPCVSATTNSGSFAPTLTASGAIAAGGRNRTSNDGKLPTAGTASFPPTAAGTTFLRAPSAVTSADQASSLPAALRIT